MQEYTFYKILDKIKNINNFYSLDDNWEILYAFDSSAKTTSNKLYHIDLSLKLRPIS